jgi:heme/copper-type cytochrome/quinol oxidase subunit 2
MAQGPRRRYTQGMQQYVTIALYVVVGILFIVLAIGVANLLRTDKNAVSRSNKLMRLRVAVQFVAILLVVTLGVLVGALHF